MQRNPVYRRIRDGAIAQGYRFASSRFASYDAFPLSALPAIHQHRKIPFIDNVTVLRQIARANDQIELVPDFLLLKRNFVFHESAHACAHQRLKAVTWSTPTDSTLRRERGEALRCLVEESFANTCDLFAAANGSTQADTLFIEVNSYASVQKIFDHQPRRLAPSLSVTLFGTLFLSFLHANYLFRTLEEPEFLRAHAFVKSLFNSSTNSADTRTLRAVFQRGLNLNPAARVIAGDFYFKAVGFRYRLERLTDFDFMRELERNASLQQALIDLTAFATGITARA